ncbi:MAG: hypothetical protein KatS3mg103_0291 [Phycisphaerales bacterium]|nr:MAG: hypothetical protein KatS3mg103_0291 [Phycisphaerales bacterium]
MATPSLSCRPSLTAMWQRPSASYTRATSCTKRSVMNGTSGTYTRCGPACSSWRAAAAAAVRKPACRPITTLILIPGKAALSIPSAMCASTTYRAALAYPGVWSLPTRSLSTVLGTWMHRRSYPAARDASDTIRQVSLESLPPM